jgi:hypothetical protein
MTEYRPLFQTQLDDTLGPWVNCGLNSVGMCADKDSLALVRPDASVLRRYLLPDIDGVTQAQALEALQACYGWTLTPRDVTPEDLASLLSDHRGALVNVIRQPLGDFCGSTFDGPHGVYVQEHRASDALLFDPLCNAPRWMDWNRIVLGGLAFGQLVGVPGRIRVALTRPARIAPMVSVKGTFWQYVVVNGLITGRRKRTSGGWSATTSIPIPLRWPDLGVRRILVRVEDAGSAYDGWYVEPVGSTVRYAGEL